MSINVENQLYVYRLNGDAVKFGDKKLLVKSSTWPDRVILWFDGVEIEVIADDLRVAVANAVNTGRR